MKTIVEIFKESPELLETKEVKELVEQFKIQFSYNKLRHYRYWDRVTQLTMNSEFFVINGMPCKEVVEKIQTLSFDPKYMGL
jgi:hypothetical protein